ncbi:Mediator of RNA polymerase II transcription subunit 27 [Dermatophagoides pteronyssinus]|uniref:Mediator of RNA polymerase II transcription subunit 27 n=1 Tax=Dermatophagoides pteronyssinus TaxID=6956 RepID=A0ABQ8IXT4_DERPT|nr:Mediator of RNA polymerase II transcription subunit 27 [Dermatophagoides pteronyssinus]
MENLNTINSALKAVSLVRSATLDTLKFMANTYQSSKDVEAEMDPNKNNSYMGEFSSLSNVLETRVRELETACTLLYPTLSSINLANTELIAQDPNYEKTTWYPDMVISYRWLSNTQEYSTLAFQALQTKFSKRNSRYRQRTSNRVIQNHNLNNHSIDIFIGQLQRSFDTMPIEVVRPFGVFTVLKIVLDRTLRAVIVLRGLVIEWDDTMDIWKPSRYKVFRTITDHCNAAILHFYAPFQMDSAIKYFLQWLRSYSTLFSAVCRKCDSRLLNDMPPTWHDFRTHEPYHFECRPY